ncbi:MAG: hypothetical protein ACP5LF_05555 [Nitrososphaeria archaeon]|nr:hypothetical protein [Conexivisphaerales archaeon]
MQKDIAVIKYFFKPSGRVLYVVKGTHHDYITGRYFCTCYDYNFRKKPGGCVHMRALAEALESGNYEEFDLDDEEYSQIFKYELYDVLSEEPR